MQYSKFNNPDSVVRDVTSTAQAICVESLEDRYYEHTNVSLYLGAAIALPVATSVVSTLVVWKHYEVIILYVENKRKKPNAVGMAMAGIYITLYMLCMDISAVYYFISRRNEYGTYDTIRNSFNLQLTCYTLLVEIIASLFILFLFWLFTSKRHTKNIDKGISFVTIIKHIAYIISMIFLASAALGTIILTKISIIEKPNLLFIISSVILFIAFVSILYIFDISKRHNDFVVYFIVIPITYLSAHVDYIFTAWLTEPSKTTSVAILAIAVVFYLFIMSRSIYTFWKFEDDRISLLVTFFLGFGGVGLGAVQIAAFYIIPIPAIHLADYLDNVFQISLVILAALISYKILSTEDSDASKFFKQFNKAHKNDIPTCNRLLPFKLLKIDAHILAELLIGTWRTKILLNQLYLSIKLNKYDLLVRINEEEYVKVPVSKVSLTCGPLPLDCEEIHYPLTATKMSFKIFNSNKRVIVSLAKSRIDGELLTNYEIRFVRQKNRKFYSGTLSKSMIQCVNEGIIDEQKVIFIPITCYITKNVLINSSQGTYCRFDNSMSIAELTPNDIEQNILKTWKNELISRSIIPGDSASLEIKVKIPPTDGYYVSIANGTILNSQLSLTNGPIQIMQYGITVKYTLRISSDRIILRNIRNDDHDRLVVCDASRERLSIPASHVQNNCVSVYLMKTSSVLLNRPTIKTRLGIAKSFQEKFTLVYNENDQVFKFNSDVYGHSIEIRDEETLHLRNFKIVLLQKMFAKMTLKVVSNERNRQIPETLEVTFSAIEKECQLYLPVNTPESDIHSLEFEGRDLANKVSSFLYFPSDNPQITPDEFEDAGLTFGEAVHKVTSNVYF